MIEILLIILVVLSIINIILPKTSNIKSESVDFNTINKKLITFEAFLEKNEKIIFDQLERNRAEINKTSKDNRVELSKNIKTLQQSIYDQLKEIREDSTRQLDKMRDTVDEKLQKTLEKRIGESFKQVSERLEEVHKGLGEMQTIATGVGDLKKVLSNVKTRGVFGEYQLGNILEQILTPEQYGTNIATKPGSQANVEYAIKLPGKDNEDTVWLPIDSKFPIEPYNKLIDAYELGEKSVIEQTQKILVKSIENFAKEISTKYIAPPNTTDFAIMFLPIEGLFAEVLRHPGLMETLRRKYKITLTGPTTLSALLNSLQMGFRTLIVQKRSSEVWKILEAVKTEFEKFGTQLDKVDKQLHTASKSLGDLRNTRSNAISRKMRDIETLDSKEAKDILKIENNYESELDS